MKKGTWSWVLRCVAFAGVLAMCLSAIAGVLNRKTDIEDVDQSDFYARMDDYDVLFFGSSHVYAGIYPMDLWRDQGIISHDVTYSGSSVAQTYWALELALLKAKPKLVVVDVYRSCFDEKISGTGSMHNMTDRYPTIPTKIAAVQDLLTAPGEETKNVSLERMIEFLVPFSAYHGRWNDLKKEDYKNEVEKGHWNDTPSRSGAVKGAIRLIEVAETKPYTPLPQSEVLEDENVAGMNYLRKIIETCRMKGIEVLLVNVPYRPIRDELNERSANSVYKLAAECGVNYLNYLAMDNVVDYKTDCYDAIVQNTHLNVSGAHKLTAHLGQYIKDHYEIPDHRNDPAYADWDEDHRAYVQAKGNDIAEQEKLSSQLMLLQDADFSSCIYVAPGSDVWQDEMIGKLLQNAAGDVTLEKMEQAQAEGKGYLLVLDHTKDSVTEAAGENLQCETVFGTVRFDAKTQQLSIAGSETCLADGMETTPDVQVFAFDNATGERIAAAQWTLQEARNYKKQNVE